jgi:hypothetical protein
MLSASSATSQTVIDLSPHFPIRTAGAASHRKWTEAWDRDWDDVSLLVKSDHRTVDLPATSIHFADILQ